MVVIHDVVVMADREVVDGARPELVRETEPRRLLALEAQHIAPGLRRQHLFPDGPEVAQSAPERVEHPLGVDAPGNARRRRRGALRGHRNARGRTVPEVLVAVHQREDRPERLRHHRRQIGHACVRFDAPRAEPRLADGEVRGDRGAGHPEIGLAAARQRPWQLGEVIEQSRRHRPRAGERVVQPPAEQGADERRQHEVRHRPVVAMARVHGQHEIGAVLQDRARESLEPLVVDRHGVGLQHDERLGAETAGDAERELDRGAAAGHTVERHGGELAGRRRMDRAHQRQPGLAEAFGGGVRRARVGVDQHGRHALEVLLEARAHRLDDLGDRRGVVVGWHTHSDVRRDEAFELPLDVGRQRRGGLRGHRSRWIASASSSTS
jgi:hypothetical protein